MRNQAAVADDLVPGAHSVRDVVEEGRARAGGEFGAGGAEGVVVGLELGPVRWVGRIQPPPVAEEPVAR